MVLDDAYTAGRNASPTDTFETTAATLCDLLDDLRGTELTWERFKQLDEWCTRENANGALIERLDSSATTQGSHPFNAPWINDFEVKTEDLDVDSRVIASDEIAQCFRDARGVNDSSSITHPARPVLAPDPGLLAVHAAGMATSGEEMKTLSTDLGVNDSEASMPGFVRNLERNGWNEGSLSSDSFFDFYGDLSDLLAQYSYATRRLADSTAAAGVMIAGFQKQLSDLAAAAKGQAESALDYWVANKAPFTADMSRESQETMVSRVADGSSTALGWMDKIPVVGQAAGYASKGADVIAFAGKSFDVDVDVSQVRSAESIYVDIVDAVHKVRQELENALDAIGAAEEDGTTFTSFVGSSQDNGNRNPPRVEF